MYSGRTGKPIYRLPGAPGDDQGYAIADAGDTDRDGVHDIISGAPRADRPGPGRAYLYSGRTAGCCTRSRATRAGDEFGSAVASAGDQNHDGYDDVLVGAPSDDGGGRWRLRVLRPHVRAAPPHRRPPDAAPARLGADDRDLDRDRAPT